MADFSPAFSSGQKRYPTATEQSTGFPCGPADRDLIGGLFFRVEEELRAVMARGEALRPGTVGAPTDADMAQTQKAIESIIQYYTDPISLKFGNIAHHAAVYGGPGSNGYWNFDSAAGSVSFNASVPQYVIHRLATVYNVQSMLSAARTASVAANQWYFLYWDAPGYGGAVPASSYPYGRIRVVNITTIVNIYGGVGGSGFDSATYDTTYDSILMAMFHTNGSAIVDSVTPFVNATHLYSSAELTLTSITNSGANGMQGSWQWIFNFGRVPILSYGLKQWANPADASYGDSDIQYSFTRLNRFHATGTIGMDYATAGVVWATVGAFG